MNSSDDEPIVLGVDPGTVVTGFAVIRGSVPLDFGSIRPPKQLPLSSRYHIIFTGLCHLIQKHSPSHVAIETPFVGKNPQSALKLGSALGCAIIAAKESGLLVFSYSPREVKRGITSLGGATKEDVEAIIRATFNLQSAKLNADACDALAIAVYHSRNANYMSKEI